MKNLVRITEERYFDNYLKIKSDQPAIMWSGFSSAPNEEKLREHFNKLIQRKDVYLYFLIDSATDELIGYNQLDQVSDDCFENKGHSVLKLYQGMGYGRLILQLATNEVCKMGAKRFGGYISEINFASINNALSCKWHKTDIYEDRYLSAFSRTDRFYYYEIIFNEQ